MTPIRYLTGVSNPAVRELAARRPELGLLVTPDTHYERQIPSFSAWGADNACFAHGDAFDGAAYLLWLRSLPHRERCLFATAPDVLLRYTDPDDREQRLQIIGDAAATWRRSMQFLDLIRAEGFPAALVAQNGLQLIHNDEVVRFPEPHLFGKCKLWAAVRYTDGRQDAVEIPWEAFDALFIGGDDRFKLWSPLAWAVVQEAVVRGKHVHMGRVNSAARLRYAAHLGCKSADGTFLKFAVRAGVDAALRRLEAWFTDDRESEATE
jgi:hypothetical protein